MTFQLPPHVEALRYMMLIGMTNNDGKDIIPELVAEIMSYCGKPTLRLDGLREIVLIRRYGFPRNNLSFKDNGTVYDCGASCLGIDIESENYTDITIKKGFKDSPTIKSHYYDSATRTLFIGYVPYREYHIHLIAYDMKARRIKHDIDNTPITYSSGDCYAMVYTNGFLYVARATSTSIEVSFSKLTAYNMEFKLAHTINEKVKPASVSLHTPNNSRYEVILQYIDESRWRQDLLRIVRSRPFVIFRAERTSLSVSGSLHPVIGDSTIFLNSSAGGKTCCLRTKVGLKKVADFDLGGKTIPRNNIFVDGRWTLSYYSSHLVRVHPYADE